MAAIQTFGDYGRWHPHLHLSRATLCPNGLHGGRDDSGLKAVVARYRDDAAWARVRPPLAELDSAAQQAVYAGLDALGFDMPGIT